MNVSKQKQSFIILLSIFVLLVVGVINYVTPQDTWFCKEGEWSTKGSPKTTKPITICPLENKSILSAPTAVENFYNWYFSATGEIVKDALYKDSDYLSSRFKSKVRQNLAFGYRNNYDPFICNHKEDPSSITIKEIFHQEDRSRVILYQNYQTSQDKLEIILVREEGLWKIFDIRCQRPFDSTSRSTFDIGNTDSKTDNQVSSDSATKE